jgi:hypothetical protein
MYPHLNQIISCLPAHLLAQPPLAPLMTTTLPLMLLLILLISCHASRSATGHLLQVYGVPISLHRDL